MDYRVTSFAIALVFVGLGANSAAAWGDSTTVEKTAPSGKEIYIYGFSSVNPDCSTAGSVPYMKAVYGPSHGKISIVNGKTFTHFTKDNIRAKCNTHKVNGVRALYRSVPGFKGQDRVVLSIHTYLGRAYSTTVNIKVE